VTTFSAGITTRAENSADAQALIDYLSSVEVAGAITDTGLEPVVLEEGIDKLTYRRGLALPDRGLSALYVDVSAHSERVLTSKDA
ncbi:MAG: hypothetical protein IIA08_09335, partial [Proteobacteria bacterium]|nr:hypothetical protein [Pseudomonadota bacterium]